MKTALSIHHWLPPKLCILKLCCQQGWCSVPPAGKWQPYLADGVGVTGRTSKERGDLRKLFTMEVTSCLVGRRTSGGCATRTKGVLIRLSANSVRTWHGISQRYLGENSGSADALCEQVKENLCKPEFCLLSTSQIKKKNPTWMAYFGGWKHLCLFVIANL